MRHPVGHDEGANTPEHSVQGRLVAGGPEQADQLECRRPSARIDSRNQSGNQGANHSSRSRTPSRTAIRQRPLRNRVPSMLSERLRPGNQGAGSGPCKTARRDHRGG